MEVGPLNRVSPSVQGPKEGKTGQTERISPQVNRLDAESQVIKGTPGDTVNIATRGQDIRELQDKAVKGNIAQKAVEKLIDKISETPTTLKPPPKDDNAAVINDATSVEFNGKPVFDGSTLVNQTEGKQVSIEFPGKKNLSELAEKAVKDAANGQLEKSASFKEIKNFCQQLKEFSGQVKADIRGLVGITNQNASRARAVDVDQVRQSLAQVASRVDTSRINQARDMSAMVVKLLK